MLLIDYLEEAAEYLRVQIENRHKLEDQYRRIYDRDIKREISIVNRDIKKKKSEITTQLLLNLDEFRYLKVYFPELLDAFMEDEYIGKIISSKSWLLYYKPLPPKEAAMKMNQLKMFRAQLKEAKKFTKTWVGTVNSKAFAATFPILKGRITGKLTKGEVVQAIEKADKELMKEGWLLLISDSLIKIPLSKFSNKIIRLRVAKMQADAKVKYSRGRGTVAETNALREYNKIARKLAHYENLVIQILLANPNFLRNMKKNHTWLSRDKLSIIEKVAETVTPRTVKERAWLNEMNEKLAIDIPAEESHKPSAKKTTTSEKKKKTKKSKKVKKTKKKKSS
ncbi:hypothetical protein KKE92_06360 [Candidatus Micrarchaeota archaeon]|nr:hypothetical protein [Candidatus Micrarchaeota archaeon]MBU1681455.1 hypothetical protein [Candidatus Micrarchaeota archaeon]